MLNVHTDHQRRKRRRDELTETEVGEKTFQAAQAALAQLKEYQRQLLVWMRVEGYSHAEVARRLGKTESSVRVSLHRAQEKFKRAYEALEEEQ